MMYTYYVHEETPGIPRLMRKMNHAEAQALAGVIEDLDLSYDLVDGTQNPTNIKDLPSRRHGGRRERDLHGEPDSQGQRARRRAIGSDLGQGQRLPAQPPLDGDQPSQPGVRGPVRHRRERKTQ